MHVLFSNEREREREWSLYTLQCPKKMSNTITHKNDYGLQTIQETWRLEKNKLPHKSSTCILTDIMLRQRMLSHTIQNFQDSLH